MRIVVVIGDSDPRERADRQRVSPDAGQGVVAGTARHPADGRRPLGYSHQRPPCCCTPVVALAPGARWVASVTTLRTRRAAPKVAVPRLSPRGFPGGRRGQRIIGAGLPAAARRVPAPAAP